MSLFHKLECDRIHGFGPCSCRWPFKNLPVEEGQPEEASRADWEAAKVHLRREPGAFSIGVLSDFRLRERPIPKVRELPRRTFTP